MANSKYGRIIAIATSVCTILLGVLFIICCTHLYFTGGDKPFSRESVGSYLAILAIPSFITIAISITGLVFAYVNKIKDDELSKRTNLEILESFKSRFIFNSFDEETRLNIIPLKKRKDIANIIAISVSAICSVVIAIYFLFIGDFSNTDLNREILSAMAVLLPLSVVAVAIHIPKVYIVEKCAKEEYNLLKASIKAHGIPSLANVSAPEKLLSSINITKCVIFCVAAIFIVIGIFNGGMADVLQKAVKICTECIGLG